MAVLSAATAGAGVLVGSVWSWTTTRAAFRREKFVPNGGPSGGDGGRGGDVVIVSSVHYNTLLHLRFNPEHKAERGGHGEGSNRTGKDGEDREVKVPVGTVVYDWDTAEQ